MGIFTKENKENTKLVEENESLKNKLHTILDKQEDLAELNKKLAETRRDFYELNNDKNQLEENLKELIEEKATKADQLLELNAKIYKKKSGSKSDDNNADDEKITIDEAKLKILQDEVNDKVNQLEKLENQVKVTTDKYQAVEKKIVKICKHLLKMKIFY